METLLAWDRALFEKLNQVWVSDFQDLVFPILTDLHTLPLVKWILLPLVLGFWIWRQKSLAVRIIVVATLAVGLADAFSYRVIKSQIKRPRPAFSGVTVQLRTHSHTGPSFPSNHSANNFAAAVLIGLCLPRLLPLLLLIAATVAYSRVYVGVHFPLDVSGGAIIGSLIGLILWWLTHRWIERGRFASKWFRHRRAET